MVVYGRILQLIHNMHKSDFVVWVGRVCVCVCGGGGGGGGLRKKELLPTLQCDLVQR